MKTYTKRIGFVLPARQSMIAGGVAQFAKGFATVCENNNWKMDLITDKQTKQRHLFYSTLKNLNVNVISPKTTMGESKHKEWYPFDTGYSLEETTNIRNAVITALQDNVYDMIIVNTVPSIVALHALSLNIPYMLYTHDPQLIFPTAHKTTSTQEYFDVGLGVCNESQILLGTQTDENNEILTAKGFNVKTLPMPMTEPDLLTQSNGDKEGVLFIGRWEDRKQSKRFIKLIKDTGLPAKVMTSPKSAKSFKKQLDEIGATYDIRTEIMGKEKVDFIKSAKVFYNPSNSESYGFGVLECLSQMPCVVHDYEWVNNFNKETLFILDIKEDAKDVVKSLYNNPVMLGGNAYVNTLEQECYDAWQTLLATPQTKKSNTSKFSKLDNLYLEDYRKECGRDINYDDVNAIVNSAGLFKRTYTDNDTWFSKSNTPPQQKTEKENTTFNSLF